MPSCTLQSVILHMQRYYYYLNYLQCFCKSVLKGHITNVHHHIISSHFEFSTLTDILWKHRISETHVKYSQITLFHITGILCSNETVNT